MAVFTSEQKQLTRELIRTVTGFNSGEENYRLCFQFAKSNFKYHRYLDVNDLNVTRAVTGLCEKFRVHSQQEKAKSLECLSEQFLSSRLERNFPRSDAHYGVLLLLLCVSDSPLHADYIPTPKTPPAPELSDSFDWASYLMEGIEYPRYSDTDEWSQISESSSSRGSTRPPSPIHTSESADSAVGEELLDDSLDDDMSPESQTKSRILKQVTFPYWDPTNPDYQTHERKDPISSSSAHSACGLASMWLTYVQSVDPIYHYVEKVTLSEIQVVRETLWVLLGAEKSFVFTFDKESVGLHRSVQLSHLTPLSLRRCLETFALVATKLYLMRRFCKAVVHMAAFGSHDPTKEEKDVGVAYVSCRTYEAFANALQCCLEELMGEVKRVERTIVEHSGLVTLLSLEHDLRNVFRLIHGLYDVFDKGVASLYDNETPPTSASKCTCRLLNELWKAIQRCDILGVTGKELLQLVFPLWAMSIQPYIELVEQWMVSGSLEDRSGEFCVKRSEKELGLSLQYWQECFSLSSNEVPSCLQPIAKKVLISGKSMHLIESFGKLKAVEHIYSSTVGPATPPTHLYDQFLQALQTELKRESCDIEDVSRDQSVRESPSPSPPPTDKNLEEELFHDNALMREFCSSLKQTASSAYLKSSHIQWKHLVDLIEDAPLLTPLSVLIQTSLFPIVDQGYKKNIAMLMLTDGVGCTLSSDKNGYLLQRLVAKASSSLCRLLRSEYTMKEHFHTVWMFYLMEAGPTIHHFCSDVFQQIQNNEPWEDSAYLNTVLLEAMLATLGHHHNISHLERSLVVQCSPSPSSLPSHHHTIPTFTLHYEVPWPLNIIFSDSVMSVYNQVFQLLLHVRWAKWSLEQLRTRASVLASLPDQLSHKLHLLYLLRAKLVHFVNNLNNYLVTRILHSAGLEFHRKLEEAEDLDEVIKVHQDYTNIIFDRCLLNKKANVVKEAIMNVLRLAVEFSERWREGVEEFAFSEAEKIEVEFSRCSHFLVSCLNNVTKRGHFPHLETLSFSMQTLKSAEKVFSSNRRAKLKPSFKN